MEITWKYWIAGLISLFLTVVSLMMPLTVSSADSSRAGEQPNLIAVAKGPIMLESGATRATLKLITTQSNEGKTLATRINALTPGRHLYLVVRDLRVAEQPGVLYRLYLDLAASEKPRRTDLHYTGTLNFFNAGESGRVDPTSGKDSKFFSYDITPTVRALQVRQLLSDETTITIIPSGTPVATSQPSIGRIEIVEQ